MKAFILTEEDFKRLQAAIDRDPQYGFDGGSGKIITEMDRGIYREAHRFYNYQICNWINSVQKDK